MLTLEVPLEHHETTDCEPVRGPGYQPRPPARNQLSRVQIAANKVVSGMAFQKKFGRPLPDWWPLHADGNPILHAYRLLDGKFRRDLAFQGVPPAISHLVEPEKPVNFHQPEFKVPCLEHIDKISKGNYSRRPFLSASWDLSNVVAFARSICFRYKTVQLEDCVFLRIDLIALWQDGLFEANTFLDVSSELKFTSYFKGEEIKNFVSSMHNVINLASCVSASQRLKEVLLGLRGRWWKKYALKISIADAPLIDQTDIPGEPEWGLRLRELYQALKNKYRSKTQTPAARCQSPLAISHRAKKLSSASIPPMPNRPTPPNDDMQSMPTRAPPSDGKFYYASPKSAEAASPPAEVPAAAPLSPPTSAMPASSHEQREYTPT